MDRIHTSITSSFMGLVRRAPCPVCGAPIAVNFGFTSLMLCPNCGDYLEVVDKMLRQMDPSSISAAPAFAAATPWSDMHAPTVETFSFATQLEDVIGDAAQAAMIKREHMRVVDAQWPDGCCICGSPPTRSETIARTFTFTPPGLIRVRSKQATIIARGIPHCSNHEHGAEFERAMFSTPGQDTVVGLFFRSYAYQIRFRNLNRWRWTDESERPATAWAAGAAAPPATRSEGPMGAGYPGRRWMLLPLGLAAALAALLWPSEALEPPAPSFPPSEAAKFEPQAPDHKEEEGSGIPAATSATPTITSGVAAIRNALAALPPGGWIANGEFNESSHNRISGLGSLSDMRVVAESGDARAQVMMGLNSDYGANGADVDWDQANEWYRRAAAAGEPVAQSKLGWRSEEGSGMPRDYSEAARLYSASAAKGLLFSQFRLGVLLYEGREGVPQDQVEGLLWLQRAAAGGRLDARYYMSEHNLPPGL